jgi:hypothetical protein
MDMSRRPSIVRSHSLGRDHYRRNAMYRVHTPAEEVEGPVGPRRFPTFRQYRHRAERYLRSLPFPTRLRHHPPSLEWTHLRRRSLPSLHRPPTHQIRSLQLLEDQILLPRWCR